MMRATDTHVGVAVPRRRIACCVPAARHHRLDTQATLLVVCVAAAQVRDRRRVQTLTVDDVSKVFEDFAPLESLAPKLPSLPPRPIAVQRDVGTPRPASHNMCHGGMQVCGASPALATWT